jgi:hypothetical protein
MSGFARDVSVVTVVRGSDISLIDRGDFIMLLTMSSTLLLQ